MRRIEALVDALAKLYGGLSDPLSDAYKLRNPIMLKAFNPKHERDDKGYRRFKHLVAGYENAILDVKIKCSGRSRSHLQPVDPLWKLVCLYGNPRAATRTVVKFLRHALNDDTIPEDVTLSYFIEGEIDARSSN